MKVDEKKKYKSSWQNKKGRVEGLLIKRKQEGKPKQP